MQFNIHHKKKLLGFPHVKTLHTCWKYINETHISLAGCITIKREGLQCLLESMSHRHSLASIATSQYTDVQLLSIAQTLQDRANILQQNLLKYFPVLNLLHQ